MVALTLAATPKVIVLVFPVEDSTKQIDQVTLDAFNDFLTAELGRRPGIAVLPRGEIRSRLAVEKAETYRACYDDACQIELGKELAANKVVSTKISALGTQCLVSSYLFDLASSASEASAAAVTTCSGDGLAAAVKEVARGLTETDTPKSNEREHRWIRGITVAEIEARDFAAFAIPRDAESRVIVLGVEGVAKDAGLRVGDVLLAVSSLDRKRRARELEVHEVLSVVDQAARDVFVRVLRGGQRLSFRIPAAIAPTGGSPTGKQDAVRTRSPVGGS